MGMLVKVNGATERMEGLYIVCNTTALKKVSATSMRHKITLPTLVT